MRTENEKVQTPGERRNQEECGNCDIRDSLEWVGQTSRSLERESVAPDRDDRTGGNSHSTPITTITGGILEQLIAEAKDDLANSEARVDQLRDRIELLTSLSASLDNK